MPLDKNDARKLVAQTAEEVLNDESYHLYVQLIASITAYQLGKGSGPTDDEVQMWRAVQSRRIETRIGDLDTFFHRPDRRKRLDDAGG